MESAHQSPGPRRNRRLRLACARCQKRKIKCDGQYPTCNHCKKVAVVCRDGDSLRLRDVTHHDDEVASLKSRIESLEAALHDRERQLEQSRAHNLGSATENNPLQPPGDAGQAPGSQAPSLPVVLLSGSNENALSHEIGMVSTGNSSAPRYIGPSSGYFLSRMLFGTAPSLSRRNRPSDKAGESSMAGRSTLALDLLDAARSTTPLPDKARALHLVDAYFDVIAPQYPIFFRPSFMRSLDELYEARANGADFSDKLVIFHTYMVLALGATIMSHRLNIALPCEAYCMSALEQFDEFNIEKTLPGLQCILLVLIFAMYNPHMKVNVWYLNYHCIAALLDLGLQRNITARSGISLMEQEMRTRLFWVVFTLDRTIATIMGRPIGLRDEACELRYPRPNDDGLVPGDDSITLSSQPPPYMTYALHLFKAARLNSEIKYVANSIVRDTPRYAYPPPTNLHDWQGSLADQLDEWYQTIPDPAGGSSLMTITCQIRYHTLMMALMRPSPAIPHPSAESLKRCHKSSQECVLLFDKLYRDSNLVYSWTVFHGLLLSIVTLLYCIRASPGLAVSFEPDEMVRVVYKGLNVLSAAGEYWPGAKRSRNVLDDLLQDVNSWVKDLRRPGAAHDSLSSGNFGNGRNRNSGGVPLDHLGSPADFAHSQGTGQIYANATQSLGNLGTSTIVVGNMMTTADSTDPIFLQEQEGFRTEGLQADPFALEPWGLIDQADIDSLMHNFFTEFGPDNDMV